MNKKIIIDENGIQCPYCESTIIDCMEDYILRYTSIQAEYEYEDRDTPYNMIIQNEWYVPTNRYNNKINYCEFCGKKLNWKRFYLDHKHYFEKTIERKIPK